MARAAINSHSGSRENPAATMTLISLQSARRKPRADERSRRLPVLQSANRTMSSFEKAFSDRRRCLLLHRPHRIREMLSYQSRRLPEHLRPCITEQPSSRSKVCFLSYRLAFLQLKSNTITSSASIVSLITPPAGRNVLPVRISRHTGEIFCSKVIVTVRFSLLSLNTVR